MSFWNLNSRKNNIKFLQRLGTCQLFRFPSHSSWRMGPLSCWWRHEESHMGSHQTSWWGAAGCGWTCQPQWPPLAWCRQMLPLEGMWNGPVIISNTHNHTKSYNLGFSVQHTICKDNSEFQWKNSRLDDDY